MRKTINLAFSILLISLLIGCYAKNIKEDYVTSTDESKGLIVGTLTTEPDTGDIAYYYVYKKSGDRLTILQSRFERFLSSDPSDFTEENVRGRLFAIEAPPGEYQITSWQVDTGSAFLSPKELPKPLEFKVEAGTVTYIGDLRMMLIRGKNIFGFTITSSSYPTIINHFDRDYPMFLSVYPKLSDMPYIIDITHTGPWVTNNSVTKEVKIPVIITK